MKKIIFSIAAVMAFGFANAQDKEGGAGLAKGDLLLTGDFNYSSSKVADDKSSNLNLAPGLGYMISDNLAVIGQLAISSGSTETGGVEAKTSGFGVAAGVRYFLTPASNFSLSLGAQLGYGSDEADDVKTNTTSLSIPVGLHYFVSDNFAITSTWGGLSYSSSKLDVEGAEAENTLGLGLGMSSISFGLLYKL